MKDGIHPNYGNGNGCEFLESDNIGGICHASDDDVCPNYLCEAKYDENGNILKDKENGLDRETKGLY